MAVPEPANQYLPSTVDSVLFGEVRHLQTGARRRASVPVGGIATACSVSYCLTALRDGRTRVTARDGTHPTVLRGFSTYWTGPVMLDRFVVLQKASGAMVLHDLRAGGSAEIETSETGPPDIANPLVSTPGDQLLRWRSGDAWVLVDLAAIR